MQSRSENGTYILNELRNEALSTGLSDFTLLFCLPRK